MLIAVITIATIALIAGVGLSFASRRLPSNDEDLVERVNELLPQTQCAQCGYPGCRPYAAAVVEGTAEINLCPPGGEDTIRRLADLLGRTVIPLAESVVPSVASSTNHCVSDARTAATPALSTLLLAHIS